MAINKTKITNITFKNSGKRLRDQNLHFFYKRYGDEMGIRAIENLLRKTRGKMPESDFHRHALAHETPCYPRNTSQRLGVKEEEREEKDEGREREEKHPHNNNKYFFRELGEKVSQ